MLLAFVYLLVLLSVPVAGGRLAALGDLRLRGAWLAVGGIALQVLVISVLPGGSHALHAGVHVASYGLLGGFAWVNRRVAGVWVVALGGALNLVAIAGNGGVMPVASWAAGSVPRSAAGDFANSAAVSHPRLVLLGDVLPTPASWPLHNVYSVGDVLIVVGVLVLVHVVCGSRLGRWLRRVSAVGGGFALAGDERGSAAG